MAFIYDVNSTLSAVTLRTGAEVTANNHSTGTSIASFKGSLMVVLTDRAPNGDAAANYTLNVYSSTASSAGGTLVASFSQVTNAAPSIQRVAVDTRNVNVYLSTQINVAGTNFASNPVVVAYGINSANG